MRNPARRPAEVSHAPRSGPDEAHAAACARVKQLQNAIDDPLVTSLRAELQKARSKARVVPVEDRIKSTTAFLGRARKRGIGGREGVGGCTGGRPGEARLERHRAEAAQDVCPPTVVESSVNAELERLRGLVADLMRPNSEGRSTTLSEPGRNANSDVVRTHECRVGGTRRFRAERTNSQASVQAAFFHGIPTTVSEKKTTPHIGCPFTPFGPRGPNRGEFVHFNSDGFGKCPRPFIHDGASCSQQLLNEGLRSLDIVDLVNVFKVHAPLRDSVSERQKMAVSAGQFQLW